jgi:hypothetical protein
MTRNQARTIARAIDAGADASRYHVGGVLPDEVLDQIVDISMALGCTCPAFQRTHPHHSPARVRRGGRLV